jgi:hypothetical protein
MKPAGAAQEKVMVAIGPAQELPMKLDHILSMTSSRLVNHFLGCTGGSTVVVVSSFQKTILRTIARLSVLEIISWLVIFHLQRIQVPRRLFHHYYLWAFTQA